jgi:hypothetical protein
MIPTDTSEIVLKFNDVELNIFKKNEGVSVARKLWDTTIKGSLYCFY